MFSFKEAWKHSVDLGQTYAQQTDFLPWKNRRVDMGSTSSHSHKHYLTFRLLQSSDTLIKVKSKRRSNATPCVMWRCRPQALSQRAGVWILYGPLNSSSSLCDVTISGVDSKKSHNSSSARGKHLFSVCCYCCCRHKHSTIIKINKYLNLSHLRKTNKWKAHIKQMEQLNIQETFRESVRE